MLQAVHARAMAEALAKQAAVHVVAMLKSEVVTQFAADQFGSTASSVSSAAGGWQRPASSALSSTREPPSQAAAPSRLGVGSAVHGGWWRVPSRHRPQPHACCVRHIVRA
jgi:hypothetical protein